MAKQRHFIREWRKFRGYTQEQLAEMVGVDRTYVSKIEKGAHEKKGGKRYDQPFLEAAAVALQCEPADLIMRDPSQPGSIWSIWDQIAPPDRETAARVLEGFVKKSGTDSR
jgi:transcriptional regulator with XRE-family HTH domain